MIKQLICTFCTLFALCIISNKIMAQTFGDEGGGMGNNTPFVTPTGFGPIYSYNGNFLGYGTGVAGAPTNAGGNSVSTQGVVSFTWPDGTTITTNSSGQYVAGTGVGSCSGCASQAQSAAQAVDYANSQGSAYAAQAAAQAQAQVASAASQGNYYYYFYYSYFYSGHGTTTGSSPAPPNPPTPTPSRFDTIKATKVNCDTSAYKRDTSITSLLAGVSMTPEMINLRDSASIRKFEVGLSIDKKPNTSNYVQGYDKNGRTRNVDIQYTNWSYADVHTHPPVDSAGNVIVDGPSPVDFYHVLNVWKGFSNSKFRTTYTVSGGTQKNEYAITITDTNALKAFYTAHPKDSVINSTTNNWKGADGDLNTLFGQFMSAYRDFIKEGYPKEYCEDYANVYMLSQLNMGTKMYRKEMGEFKELNFYTDTDTAGKQHKKIKICL